MSVELVLEAEGDAEIGRILPYAKPRPQGRDRVFCDHMSEACLDEVVRFASFQFLLPREVHDQDEIGRNWMAVPKDRSIPVTSLARHRSSIVVPDQVQM